VEPPALPVAAPPVVVPAEPAPAPEPTPETPTANDDEGDVAMAEPRALPVAAPPPPPLAGTPADGVEDDGDTARPVAPSEDARKLAAQWKQMAEGKHTQPDAKKCFATVPRPRELAHPFLERAIGQLNSRGGRRSRVWESLANAIDFEVSETDSRPKLQQRSEAVFDALEGVSAAEFLPAARVSASASASVSAPAMFAKDTQVEDVNDATVRGVVLSEISFSVREVATTERTVVMRYTNQLKIVTLSGDEAARCIRPATPKDYVQARIDGLIRFSYDGHVYRNRFTANDDSMELRQFTVSDTHVQCAYCDEANTRAPKTWALSSDISKIVREVSSHSTLLTHQRAVATAAGTLQVPSAPVPRIATAPAPAPSLYDRRVTKADWPEIVITDAFQKKRELTMPVVVTDWGRKGMCEGREIERFPGRKRIKINPSGGTLSFQKASLEVAADALRDRLAAVQLGSADPYAGPTHLILPPPIMGMRRATLVHTSADGRIRVRRNPWATRPGAKLFLMMRGGVVDKLLEDGAECSSRESELHRRGRSGAPSGVNWYVAAPRSLRERGMMPLSWLTSVDAYGAPPPTARALSNVTGCGTVLLPQNFRFVLRDDAVSLSARRVHQPFPAYASRLVADVQAVLNEVISLGGPHADDARESLDFFTSRSLPAPPTERPPGESGPAIRERTMHLRTEPVTRRPSPRKRERFSPADAHHQQQAASVRLTWNDEFKAEVRNAVRTVYDRQGLDTVPGCAKTFWEAVAGELKLPLDIFLTISLGWQRCHLTLPPPPPVAQAPAEPAPAESEPMSVEAPLPDASVEPADGQGDDLADDAASGDASDAAGDSSDADYEGSEASDDSRDAAEDDVAADLLIEEILDQPGFDSNYIPSGSDSESDELL